MRGVGHVWKSTEQPWHKEFRWRGRACCGPDQLRDFETYLYSCNCNRTPDDRWKGLISAVGQKSPLQKPSKGLKFSETHKTSLRKHGNVICPEKIFRFTDISDQTSLPIIGGPLQSYNGLSGWCKDRGEVEESVGKPDNDHEVVIPTESRTIIRTWIPPGLGTVEGKTFNSQPTKNCWRQEIQRPRVRTATLSQSNGRVVFARR